MSFTEYNDHSLYMKTILVFPPQEIFIWSLAIVSEHRMHLVG